MQPQASKQSHPSSSPHPRRRRLLLAGSALAAAALGAGLAPRVRAQPAPRRVLIVHSFGRSIAPYDAVIAAFRTELAARSRAAIRFQEAALDATHPLAADEQAAFVAYLRARFTQPAPDLVVSSAGPAAQFLASHREQMFAGVPILFTAIDERVVARLALRAGDAVVAVRIDLLRAVDAMLRVLPRTRTIAVVTGATPLERYWRAELQREAAPLASRVDFVWFDALSLEQMRARVAALAADSAVFYGLLVVDAAGVPHERLEALTALRQVATVPIFSLFEGELGLGVVGGPYVSQTRMGREAALLALRSLAGAAPPAAPAVVIDTMDRVAYDQRELRRWRIDPARLPPGSELRFAPPPPWVEYREELAAVAAVIVLQAALIAALLLQRARRRRAEDAARTLGGRLITAYDDEGRRIARELHDDVTQRLAGASIELATLPRLADPGARAAMEQAIGTELASLSRDVHALAYRLHPSVLDDLGLVEALRVECERIGRRGAALVAFDAGAAADAVRGERALCLFRVAQEALRNAARHARATRIDAGLRGTADGGVELSVADDGCGFDPLAARERASLGLASMRERVALLGGRLEIDSRRGAGTRVVAWLPAQEAV